MLTPAESSSLREAYEISKMGESIYSRRMAVKDLLEEADRYLPPAIPSRPSPPQPPRKELPDPHASGRADCHFRRFAVLSGRGDRFFRGPSLRCHPAGLYGHFPAANLLPDEPQAAAGAHCLFRPEPALPGKPAL